MGSIKEFAVYSHLANTKPIQILECLGDDEYKELIPSICESSQDGFNQWSSKTPNERANVFEKAIELMRERKAQFVEGHKQIGGPNWFANFNVDGAITQMEQYIACIRSNTNGVIPQSEQTSLALVYKRPIGPVLSIAPWNAPVILGCRAISAPLAAGCSVVLKSSEKSPLLSYLLVRCFHDAGVPKNALQLINATGESVPSVVNEFLSNNTIKMINFTGSTKVGREIAQIASANLKPYLLELGGKNCSIVEHDADLDKCIPTVLANSWWHQGQICMSTDKVYIHASIYENFKNRLLVAAKIELDSNQDLKIPQRDQEVSRKVSDLVQDAISKGANVFGNSGHEPLILEGISPDMKIDSEEIFGPVFSIHKYEDIESVINDINRTSYGLKASIWSNNVLNAIKYAGKIQCGGVHINRMSIHDEATIPHGGIKSSGQGRFNSTWESICSLTRKLLL